MQTLTRFKYFLWFFTRFKVPLIGYLKPSLIALTDEEVIIKLKLNRRSKNHLHSMYFGALAIGADLAAGLHGYYFADLEKLKISLAFKSMHAQFLKRPEADVFFVSTMGKTIQDMLHLAKTQQNRVNTEIAVTAYTHYPENPEVVARFVLELSLKVVQ